MQYPLSAVALEKARGLEEVEAAVELLMQEVTVHAQTRVIDTYAAGVSVAEIKTQVEIHHRKVLEDPKPARIAFYRGLLRGLGHVIAKENS